MPTLDQAVGPAASSGSRIAATLATTAGNASQERITIGRELDNDVVVADPLVSRRHAVVERGSGEPLLRDLDSFNGTFLNNSRVEGPARLRPRDLVGIGAAQLRWDGDRLVPLPPNAGLPLVAEDLSVVTKGGKVLLDQVSLTLPAGHTDGSHRSFRGRKVNTAGRAERFAAGDLGVGPLVGSRPVSGV